MALFTRRAFLAASTASLAAPAFAEPPHDVQAAEDFDELWRTLGERYCFFSEKATDWNRVRAVYRPLAIAAQSVEDFQAVVGQVLNELYDPHTHLSSPADGSPRFPYFDLCVERVPGGVRITEINMGSNSGARLAQLSVGDIVVQVDGRSVFEVAAERMPRCLAHPDPAADAYALNSAVSGRRAQPRRFVLSDGRDVGVPLVQGFRDPDISHGWQDGGPFGWISLRSFADQELIGAFDEALGLLRDTPGLIIDVRRNGGGDTAVARPIMGRFIRETRPYARMRRRQGRGLSPEWTETVEPRGPFTYDKPVAVLTDRFSGSMAEGFPMGMRAICGARIVGRPMMGLGAAVFPIRLDRTGIEAQYSGEPVYDVNHHPRWRLRPDVETRPGEDIMAAGVAELRRLTA